MTEHDKFKSECAAEIRQQSADGSLKELTSKWIAKATEHKYSYHFEWLGRPIIQYPQDIVAMQELIWSIKPDLIIETGIAHGGSLILSASMLALLDMAEGTAASPQQSARRVLGIDIDIREHNRDAIEAHPFSGYIKMMQGSSVDAQVVAEVRTFAKDFKRVLVCLDSNHTHQHVLDELNAYAPLVSVGSYCVVFDTIVEDLPKSMYPNRPWGPGDNPKTAARAYLKDHPEFVNDTSIPAKLQVTVAPDGYLRRLR